MSDARRVARDTKHGEEVMSTAVTEASFYLNELTRIHHRGRGDTLSAARDRAARFAGVERTYAKRIWDRWQSMTDVSGEAYRKLRLAYERACEKHEAAAAAYRAERLKIEAEHNANNSGLPDGRVGMGAPEMGAMAEGEKR